MINIPLGVTLPEKIDGAQSIVRSNYNISNDSFVILFLSRLHPKKRPEVAIEMAAKLKDRHQIHLIIAGDGDEKYKTELQELSEKLSISDQVTFVGFVEGKEKGELLQGSDLFILPSLSENFGIAVAESLASGTPVVITPQVQISEYIDEYKAGAICEGNSVSFAKTVSECIENKSKMNSYRENGLRLVKEKFDWNVIAFELLRSYEGILKK